MMNQEYGAMRLILTLVFLIVVIRSGAINAAPLIATNATTSAANYTATNNSRTRDPRLHDQLAEEQRLALQIITTDSGDTGRGSSSNSGNTRENERSSDSNNGAISFDDQYNLMEAQLKRNQEASGEKVKRIVINLDSLMSNGSDSQDGGAKLTIGFTPMKPDTSKQANTSPKNEANSENSNKDRSEKNSLAKSTSKKKEVSSQNNKKGRSQASKAQTGGGSRGTMRGAVIEAVNKQGGVPAMVMRELDMDDEVMIEPKMKFMLNSETVDQVQRQRGRNQQMTTRSMQPSESTISDASLQSAIELLSGEIEALEKQLDDGVGSSGHSEQRMIHSRDGVILDTSSTNDHHRHPNQHYPPGSVDRERVQQLHQSGPRTDASNGGGGGGYYAQTNVGNRPHRQPTGRGDDRTVASDNNIENYGTNGPGIKTDNGDENDDGQNRERSNERPGFDSVVRFEVKNTNSVEAGGHRANNRNRLNGGEENPDNRNHNNDNNNHNNDDSNQNYEARASDKSSSEKVESMNNIPGTHRWHQGDGFTVSSKPLLEDNSNVFNEQVEPGAQTLDDNENKSNDMSASVAPDGSAPNPTTNDSSSGSKKLVKQRQRTTQQPTIGTEKNLEERVAQILDRLKLYTTKDHLVKVARDLQNNYPSESEHERMRNVEAAAELEAINRSGQMLQKSPRFVKRNNPVSLMDALRMPMSQSFPWPMREMAGRAVLNVEEDSMDGMEMARRRIPAPLHGGSDFIESLMTSATSTNGGGRDAKARGTSRQTQGSPDNRNQGAQYGSIEDRKRMLQDGVKLLTEFRARQSKLKSMEDAPTDENQESVEPAGQAQQNAATSPRSNEVGGGAEEYDSESVTPGRARESHVPATAHHQQDEEQEAGGSYEVTQPTQQTDGSQGETREYETTKDLADTMRGNEKSFEDDNGQENENLRSENPRKNRRYIDDNQAHNGFDDSGSEASESHQQQDAVGGPIDPKTEELQREGEAELKALEQIIDELMRREKRDRRKTRSS